MFRTVPLSIIRSFLLYTQQWYMSYSCCVYSDKFLTMDKRNCPKHVEFYSKNKFEKLVHLVGFIIRTCIQVSVNISRGNLRNILIDIVVLTLALLSFQSQQGKLPTDYSLDTKCFSTLSEHGQAEPFPKFCLLLSLLAPAGIFKVRNMKEMCSRSQNSSVGLVASLRGGRPSVLVRYRRGWSASLLLPSAESDPGV